MEAVFLKLLNMSITASWLVLALIVLRLLLKKAPKAIFVFMWALVGVRLICPFSFESVLSLIPSAETVPENIIYSEAPTIQSGIPIFNSTVNPIISENLAPEVGASVNPMQIITFAASVVWVVGIIAMVFYTLISYILIHKKVRESIIYRDNIFMCDNINTPFILGIIRPKIYLPSDINGQDIEYVTAHETAHLKRHDHWWKPLGFLLLSVYWFNPVLWIAYILLCKDIELACDEKVIKDMGAEVKKPYSNALINCSVPRKMVAACPLAFGETGVKSRIKSVLNYKKPAFWLVIVSVIVCVALAVGFLTNPINAESVFNSKYETGKCLYSYVADEDKETKSNELIYNITQDGQVYKNYSKELIELIDVNELIGTLVETDFSNKELNKILNEQGENVSLGQIESAYEISSDNNRDYVILKKATGTVYMVSFFSDGKIMDIFQLKRIGNCDVSVSNMGSVDNPTNNTVEAVDVLKAKYPQFFDVSTDGGLKVYIWQMAENDYRCYLINRGIDMFADQSFAFEVGATIAEMRAILNTYDIDQKDITIHPVNNPLSSYYYEIDDEYWAKVKELFWSTVPYVESSQYIPSIDTATFDIDGDGKQEQCSLTYGPTSGLFTFIFSVTENGELEYFNIFNSPYLELSFEKNAEGKMMLIGKDGEQTRYMGIDVNNGNIVISSDEQDISYWGAQGINSPFALKTVDRLDDAISSVLHEKYRSEKPDGLVHIESCYLLANECASGTPIVGNTGHIEEVTVYLIVYHMKYSVNGSTVEEVEGDFVPTAITFSVDENDEYTLKDYWTPRNGADYENDIRAKFPGAAADDALNIEKYAEALTNDSWTQVTAYLNSLQENN